MGAVLAAILGFFTKTFTLELVKFAAYRLLIASAIGILLPIALYNLYCYILEEVMTWASSMLTSSGIQGQVLQLSGVAAYLASHLKVVESFTLFSTFLLVKLTLRFITRRIM